MSAFLNKFKYTCTGPKVNDFVQVSLKKSDNWNFTIQKYLNIDEIHQCIPSKDCKLYSNFKH